MAELKAPRGEELVSMCVLTWVIALVQMLYNSWRIFVDRQLLLDWWQIFKTGTVCPLNGELSLSIYPGCCLLPLLIQAFLK